VRDIPEELEQTGSSRSLSLGDGRKCDNGNKTGELLVLSFTGSSMLPLCGLGRMRLKRLRIGLGEVEQFIESDFS
jgi:hypothetical protein